MTRCSMLPAFFLVFLTSHRAEAIEKADLVLLGGSIVTMDTDCPAAQALACRGDRIVAIGTREEVSAMVRPTATR